MRQNRTGAVKRCRECAPPYGTLIATFLDATAFTREEDRPGNLEQTVFSCDYNGWADVPEEEREAIEAFEAALRVQRSSLVPPSSPPQAGASTLHAPERRAA
jgi:hypothetical protein